jgi:hypothetical protein
MIKLICAFCTILVVKTGLKKWLQVFGKTRQKEDNLKIKI